ncbi:Gfo/Idh/MocA family oxidoreductase [Algoriphagus halophytocola]|uniref:Gfo/Idh/MocA family oxidoreductase n=1 Tax=Algoriphagus halophytocola TaxID=2991499 RepID=A0ABY6MCG5_9BACT|nr:MULTISPECIES: Gfo/Idh/MocA family oxidoreductase [unclassified Algoriphagus]UZD20974.1 Gfo/Idh/MocA family oxidoreductase [Algoriphagus sp. TR-M5]WBL42140.1 Gfo/Idh/MocA family oxidoreductase [Algoriphagus sp. TR-M9]
MNNRRIFLQKAGLSAMALSVPAFTPLSAMTNFSTNNQDTRTLRVAIMGLGSYGTRVAEAIQDCKRTKLVGVISGTPSKITAWQSKYNIPAKNCYNYENFDAIKDNPEIDAVYVITPNGLHKSQSIRVAQAGKHVICEKPMAVNALEAQEMVDACDKAGVKLLIGYRMHFEPNTLEIVRMRKAGELGTPLFFQGLSGFIIGDPTQWRLDKELAGGGAMMDIGIYSINGARYMLGEEPVWVTAQETKNNPEKFKEGVDETIQFQLGFPSGAVASCLSTYSMNNLDRFFLNGNKGFAELLPATGYGPIKGKTHKGPLDKPHTTHQTVQMDEMAAIIFDGKTPELPVDGREGLKDMKVIDAIFQAVRTGQKVKLDLV